MKKMLFAVVFIFLLNLASAAIRADIDIKNSFEIGEKISFNYTISSTNEQTITYIELIECEDLPVPLLFPFTEQVGPGSSVEREYTYGEVREDTEPQNCTAHIVILEPVNGTFSKEFFIDTMPSLVFELKLDKRIFIRGESIGITYEASVDPVSVEATITYPDGTTQQISLPAAINAEQIGTYSLEVIASKDGYKDRIVSENLGVIEKKVEIEEVEPPPFKEASEKPAPEPEEADNRIVYYFLIGLLVLIVLVLILILIQKNKKK